MTTPESVLADEFQAHRERLLAIATRVLGNRVDAEDVVQDAWLRLARQQAGSVENLAGWLTTVVGRLSIDVLRSRTAKPELSFEEQLRDPAVTADDGKVDGDPEENALQAESLGLALLVVLGSLTPDERLALVLHDMFAVPYSEIGPILDKSVDAAKMAASRARRKVHGAAPTSGGLREQRAVVDAFLAAARDGDFDALLRILHPDLVWEIHGPRSSTVTKGRDDLVRVIERGAGSPVTARRVLVNGRPGILAWGAGGQPAALMTCLVQNGRITRIASLTERARLVGIDLQEPILEA